MVNKLISYVPMFVFSFLTLGCSTSEIWGVPFLPGLAFAWIFHWTLYRPHQLLALPLVLIGAIYDLITDNPMGMSPLLFLSSHVAILYFRSRIFPLAFNLVWAVFAVFAILCAFTYGLLFCLLSFQWLFVNNVANSFLWAAMLYPFLSRMMIFIQRKTHYG